MKRLLLAALILVAQTGCSSDAQPETAGAPAAGGSSDVQAAARAYLDAYPVSELMSEMTDATLQQAPPAQREQIRAAMEAVDTEALEGAMMTSMVRHFSASELRALAAFYGSPEGRSVMGKMPAYMADVMPVIQQQMTQAVMESQRGAR